MPPSLHRVRPGAFPCFSGTTRHSDFLTTFTPGFVSFASALPPPPVLRSRGSRAPISLGPGLSSGCPPATSTWSRQHLPGSWRTLLSACPALRPRRDPRTWPVSALGCCLPLLVRRRLSRRFRSFEAQSRGPHTRCLRFAARVAPAPRKTRFRLVASFAGRGLNPQGPFVKFPLLHRFLLTQALPGAHESSDTFLGLGTTPRTRTS